MLKRYYKLLLLPFSILFLGFLSYFLIFDSLAQYKPNRVTTIIDEDNIVESGGAPSEKMSLGREKETLENLDSKHALEVLNNGANSTPIKPLHKDKIISHTDIEFESIDGATQNLDSKLDSKEKSDKTESAILRHALRDSEGSNTKTLPDSKQNLDSKNNNENLESTIPPHSKPSKESNRKTLPDSKTTESKKDSKLNHHNSTITEPHNEIKNLESKPQITKTTSTLKPYRNIHTHDIESKN